MAEAARSVSVIIPTYNRAERVMEALDSVLRQTVAPSEIVVVDDGSTDDTRTRIEALGARVRYVYQENAGPSAARNRGIRESCGEVIAFLDSDDLWLPDKLARQLRRLDAGATEAVAYGEALVSADYGIGVADRLFGENHWEGSGGLPWLLVPHSLYTPTVVVPRVCLAQCGTFNESLRCGEDWELFLRLASDYSLCYEPEPVAVVRGGSDNLVADAELLYRDHCRALAAFLATPQGRRLGSQARRRAWAQQRYFFANRARRVGDRRLAFRRLFDALRCDPSWVKPWRALLGVALGRPSSKQPPPCGAGTKDGP